MTSNTNKRHVGSKSTTVRSPCLDKGMPRNTAVLLLFPSFLLALTTLASSGDRAPQFQACVSRCVEQVCTTGTFRHPIALRLTRWTCTDECRYTCMHTITDQAVSAHGDVHQYYGKWPFWRLAGMQEPASVLFSLLNLFAHIRGLSAANRSIPNDHPMRTYYMGWGIVNVNAWIWSAVFHTRGK
jgi:post-GPI attachment to proteins factor 3